MMDNPQFHKIARCCNIFLSHVLGESEEGGRNMSFHRYVEAEHLATESVIGVSNKQIAVPLEVG